MTPLFLLALALGSIYLGSIDAAFSALIRLSLRLVAERTGRSDRLGVYLDDPLLLLVPLRLLLGVLTAAVTAVLAGLVGINGPHKIALVVLLVAGFVIVCELLVPLLLVGDDPERALTLLLPSFTVAARLLEPVTRWTRRTTAGRRLAPASEVSEEAPAEAEGQAGEPPAEERLIAGEERRLLQSIVDFGDTLVREVMTPRPDIVAIRQDATIGDLRALFREQEYSRFPVYADSLDNIAGFVFVKDLVALDAADDSRPITPLLRPPVIVPASKRVPELLKQFQRQQTQCAIVVDEYGGTAGLVTIEDLLEEIVGEIRDEYDEETEPVVDEGNGRFVFDGKVDIDELTQRLDVAIAREGFETVGGYVLTHLGRVPAVGERVEMDGLDVEVLQVDRRRVTKVRVSRRSSRVPEGGAS